LIHATYKRRYGYAKTHYNSADLPLSLAHDGHGVPDEAEQEAARRSAGGRRGGGGGESVEAAEVTQQVEGVDEDVVVGLEHVPRVRAVA